MKCSPVTLFLPCCGFFSAGHCCRLLLQDFATHHFIIVKNPVYMPQGILIHRSFFYHLMSIEPHFFLRQSLVVFAFKNSLFSFSICSFIFPIKSPYKTGKFFFSYSFNSLLNIMVLSVICHLLIWVLKLVLMA